MAKDLKVGDPAMLLVYLDHGHRLIEGRIVHVEALVIRIEISEGPGQRQRSREGISWLRGHHPLNSPEARAILAAAALEREL